MGYTDLVQRAQQHTIENSKDTESNPNPNRNPNLTTKQHAYSEHSTKQGHMSYVSRLNSYKTFCTTLGCNGHTAGIKRQCVL